MSMYVVEFPLLATGNINTSSFFKIDTSAPNSAVQAVVGDMPDGICQAGTQDAPGLPNSTAFAGYAPTSPNSGGNQIKFFGAGALIQLTIGTGGCTQGDLLKPDANGFGVTAAVGDKYGAKTFRPAVAGEKILVVIQKGVR